MAQNARIRWFGSDLIQTITAASGWLRDRFVGHAEPTVIAPPAPRIVVPRAYNERKRNLPTAFTARDWENALEYWEHRCAICERPRGLWHTLAQDHWVPLTSPDCPGTVPTNILPLCHGTDGCNNSKGKKLPGPWLREKLGARRAGRKLREIQDYFAWAEVRASVRPGCPHCGGVVAHFEESALWQCRSCGLEWTHEQAHNVASCPDCQCFMLEVPYGSGLFFCPRCAHTHEQARIPGLERCPGCQHGMLEWWTDEVEGWWRCRSCGSEWLDD